MNVTIDLSNDCPDASIPEQHDFKLWAAAALTESKPDKQSTEYELSIRIVDTEESAYLNSTYRKKQGSTNILSFPVTQDAHINAANYDESGIDANFLGDLAICAPVVENESKQQDKTLQAHWAHMTIHGVLHLIGYDHEEDNAALEMETLEIKVLSELGYQDPYN